MPLTLIGPGLILLAGALLLAIVADRGTPNSIEALGFLAGRFCDGAKRVSQGGLFWLADRMRARRLKIEMQQREMREAE